MQIIIAATTNGNVKRKLSHCATATVSVRLHNAWSFCWIECVSVCRLGIGNISPTFFLCESASIHSHTQCTHHLPSTYTKLPKKYMICWVEFSEVGKPEVVKDWELLNTSVIRQHHVAKTFSFINSNFDFVTCLGTRWPSNSSNRKTRSRR